MSSDEYWVIRSMFSKYLGDGQWHIASKLHRAIRRRAPGVTSEAIASLVYELGGDIRRTGSRPKAYRIRSDARYRGRA